MENNSIFILPLSELESRYDEQQKQAVVAAAQDHEIGELQKTNEKLQQSAEQERSRLMCEIERLMEEMSEVEELYSITSADNERLTEEIKSVQNDSNVAKCDRDNAQLKHQKVLENLKKV